MSIGALTADDVMLTMRPNLRAIMPSTVALMSSIGVSMLASIARSHASRSQSRKSPGGGPPGVVDQDVRLRARRERRAAPFGVVMSHATSARRARRRADFVGRLSQRRFSVRATIVTSHAFARQRLGAAAAESLARGADQRAVARDVRDPSMQWLALSRRLRRARDASSRVPDLHDGADRQQQTRGDRRRRPVRGAP